MSGVVKMVTILNQVAGKEKWMQHEKAFNKDLHLFLVSLFEFFFGASEQLPDSLKTPFIDHHHTLESALAFIRKEWNATDNNHLCSIVSDQQYTYKLPRYVRVNTLHQSTEDVIQDLKTKGLYLLPTDKNKSYNEHLDIIADMKGDVFMKDNNIKDLLIFPHGTSFYEDDLFNNGGIILQDKASCLSALALSPPPGSIVVDACAAPGNKTSYLAALMRNKGKIHAFDMDASRFSLMQTMLKKAGVKIVEERNEDFLAVFSQAHPYNEVEYMLVDPSCSGSGIVDRQDIAEIEDTQHRRLKALSNFQAMTLNHALKFPKVKKLVYSTCSVYRQENEEVVLEALTKNTKFELERIFKDIPSRGINAGGEGGEAEDEINNDGSSGGNNNTGGRYDMTNCLRLGPDKDLTNGFFIASFIRKSSFNHENNDMSNYKSRKESSFDCRDDNDNGRKRKKRSRKKESLDGSKGNNDNKNTFIDLANVDEKSCSFQNSNLKRKASCVGEGVEAHSDIATSLYNISKQSKKELGDKKKVKVNRNIKSKNERVVEKSAGKRVRKLLKKKRGREHAKPIVTLQK